MTLKYAATCHVCGEAVAAGEVGYYDYATRQVTCTAIPCADADGLTRQVWHGSPVSGRYVSALADRRIGSGFVRDPGEDAADRWLESQR
jgi:hypothetical protein